MNRLLTALVLGAIVANTVAQTNPVYLMSDQETKNVLRDISKALQQTNVLVVKLDEETRKMLHQAPEDKWFKKDVLISTLIGGALAISGAVIAVLKGHSLQAKHKQKEDAEFRANVLSAIRRELEALGEIYSKGIGAQLAKSIEGQEFNVKLAITQDWFTVFTANAVHLGKFEADISRRIIIVYALLKALIEQFRINNELLTMREEIQVGATGLGTPPLSARKELIQKWLVRS